MIMKRMFKQLSAFLILVMVLTACNGGRHPQSWQPKNHKKSPGKTPPAYRKSAYWFFIPETFKSKGWLDRPSLVTHS